MQATEYLRSFSSGALVLSILRFDNVDCVVDERRVWREEVRILCEGSVVFSCGPSEPCAK